jgi:hypothetical protein
MRFLSCGARVAGWRAFASEEVPMTFRKLFGWALLAALAAAGPLPAQVANPGEPPTLPIDAKAATAVIDGALKHLDENYVFPEVAAKMAEAIRRRLADGEYANVKTGQELAGLLSRHLQDVSKDKHLRVTCSTEKLPPQPPQGGAPTPEMRERSRLFARKVNGEYKKVERLAGNIGYLRVDAFMHSDDAAGPAAAAMGFLANTEALIIDVRYNGGGSPHGVALLCSYLFDEKPVHLNSLYWRRGNRTDDFWTLKELAGPRYVGKDVYVLTSARTFSAAEEFTYNLQCQKRATIVGETTGGGAHPGGGFRINDHFRMFVPTGRAINPITKTNWEGTGVKPDVPASADRALEVAHERAVAKLLESVKDEEMRRMIQRDLERDRQSRQTSGAK